LAFDGFSIDVINGVGDVADGFCFCECAQFLFDGSGHDYEAVHGGCEIAGEGDVADSFFVRDDIVNECAYFCGSGSFYDSEDGTERWGHDGQPKSANDEVGFFADDGASGFDPSDGVDGIDDHSDGEACGSGFIRILGFAGEEKVRILQAEGENGDVVPFGLELAG